MPRYRAKGPLFIDGDRYISAGESFISDIEPGRNWEPLDKEAEAAVKAMLEKRGSVPISDNPAIRAVFRQPSGPAAVEIPRNWESLTWAKQRAIGLALGAPGTATKPDVVSFIEAELGRRALAAA